MKIDYIIVQAGGKGTRMEHLTRNKPKALISVNNLPIIFHLFNKYPDKKYIIIGDYLCEVLERYLAAFAKVDYKVVNANGNTGTCAGLSQAIGHIPDHAAFMVIWSDLILPREFELPTENRCYTGISKDFRCRWSYSNGEFREEPSTTQGVAGLFIFEDKAAITEVPDNGEFVRWLSMKGIRFTELSLWQTKEYGLLSEYDKLSEQRCRPFNKITIKGDRVIKEGIDELGKALAIRETAWYRKLHEKHFENIPKIFSYEPLVMQRVNGLNVFEYTLSYEQKTNILRQIVNCLKSVQNLENVPSDKHSFDEAYVGKTFDRLRKVYDLVPFAHDEVVVVNGKACPNVFFHRTEIENLFDSYFPEKFKLLHGDCTFSNTMLQEGKIPMLIDPRGYFGFTEFYGDPAYDWAKLYYSIVGNYDQFNLKRFRLEIRESEAVLEIQSNHWEDMEEEFFRLLSYDVSREQIKLIHSIIWLSLTTYAWDDYDSICGAFYNGLYYLEEVL